MKAISIVWAVLLVLSVGGFGLLSLVISIKGWGELRDIFRSLGGRQS
jgi:hypothetical protein